MQSSSDPLIPLLQEIDYQKKHDIVHGGGGGKDKFVSIMSDFVSIASYNFSEVEEQVMEMKEKVSFWLCIYLYALQNFHKTYS